MQQQFFLPRIFSAIIPFLFITHALAQSGNHVVKITVSEGTTPTFSWAPDSTIGKLIVEQNGKELWGTETEGENIYHAPIRYGVHPV